MPGPEHTEGIERTSSAGETWEDRDVLEGVRRRDPDALGRFFDVAFPYVYSVAFRLLGNHEAAEDVAQDVFLKVYHAADRLDVARHPKPWLTTITYNACRDAARRVGARPEVQVDATVIGERHAASGTPEDAFMRWEQARLIERALRDLDEDARVIVILHNFCGFSHEETARIIGASHAAVRKRYSRALHRMAAFLTGLQK